MRAFITGSLRPFLIPVAASLVVGFAGSALGVWTTQAVQRVQISAHEDRLSKLEKDSSQVATEVAQLRGAVETGNGILLKILGNQERRLGVR